MNCLLRNRLIFYISLFLLSSCERFSLYEEATFKLPCHDEWLVRLSDGTSFTFIGNSFELNVDKNDAFAVCAEGKVSGMSCGAIYPYNDFLCEQNAFPAQILLSIVLSSTNSEEEKQYCLSTFNWDRFELECLELGDDIWKVNKESIIRKIAKGTFRKNDLKIEKRQ